MAGRARRPARRGEGVISGQEAEAGSRWGGGGSHAAPRGGRGQRPGRARRTAGCGPDPGCAPPASRPWPRPPLCIRRPGASLRSSPRPLLHGNSAAPNLGKSFPTSGWPGGARQAPCLGRSFSSRPPISAEPGAAGPEPSPELPGRPLPARPFSPPGPQGLAARYLRPQPSRASLPAAVAAPCRRPTRPAARRRAVPGQRPCQPRPPAPLPFPSPLQPMCGQSRARAADPAMNPAQSSVPAVLSSLGATPGALNASRVGAPAPEDAPEAASARGPGVSGSPVPPGPQPEDPPGGHVGSPGPGCRRIQGGRGCAALPSALRAPGRSVLLVRPPRVLVASQPRCSFRTLLSGAARAGRRRCSYGATSRRDLARHSRDLPPAHLGWRIADAGLAEAGAGGGCSQVQPPRCAHLETQASDLRAPQASGF